MKRSGDNGHRCRSQPAQNYDVPANVDLRKDRVVSIWCNRFSVNFACKGEVAGKKNDCAGQAHGSTVKEEVATEE